MAKRLGSATDPLWHEDAIIYGLHVRAFKDGNAYGIGDFLSLIQKIDYLQDLGITCRWLPPFFTTPLKDDGYDVSDYLNLSERPSNVRHHRQFSRVFGCGTRSWPASDDRAGGHTSDQHPWFQRPVGPRGSPEHDFYVWNDTESDTEERYKDARIVVSDTERSNWTWDSLAEQYYWHRFFSHQPDLNYENPAVVEEV